MPSLADKPTYRELLVNEEPHPIKTEAEAAEIQKRIDELIDKGTLSDAEEEYLALLGTLIMGWEEGRYEVPDLTVPEILHSLLEDNGLRQIDLVGSVFSSKGVVSEILSGKRSVTYDHVAKLAQFFHVSPAVFYPG
jgi:HTH-type transcriptional regulator/antitoxin HigA